MIKIRRIQENEGAKLRAIRLSALRESPAAFGSSLARELGFDEAIWSQRARESASGAMGATLIAVGEDQEWVGLVVVLGPDHPACNSEVTAELVAMWVAPSVRQEGLGMSLVKAAVAYSRSIKAQAIGLSVVRANRNAHALYRRSNFVEVEDSLPQNNHCFGEIRMELVHR